MMDFLVAAFFEGGLADSLVILSCQLARLLLALLHIFNCPSASLAEPLPANIFIGLSYFEFAHPQMISFQYPP
jgi:hypothetical protein